MAEEKQITCPHCRENINKEATKCPHCQSDVRGFFRRHPIITFLIILFLTPAFMAAIDGENSNQQNNSVVEKKGDPKDIVVSSQIVKMINGKCRYFFDINNKDKNNFSGKVIIELINQEGKTIWSDTFSTAVNSPISPNIGKSVYTDANTCPVSQHGSAGIDAFKYRAIENDAIVSEGNGKISDKLEAL